MSLSFQYQKHLSLGRGGAVLCSNIEEYEALKSFLMTDDYLDIPGENKIFKHLDFTII